MSQSNSEPGFYTPCLRLFLSGEQLFANLALAAMVLLPLAEIVFRPILAGGIPGSIPFVQHLTLWVGFLGASLAARDGKLIALATASFLPDGRTRHATQVFAALVGAAVSMILAAGAYDLMMLDREDGTIIAAGVPVWLAQLVLPLSFSLIGLRLVWRASPSWPGRAMASVGLLVGLWLGGTGGILESGPVWPLISMVLAAAVFGAPNTFRLSIQGRQSATPVPRKNLRRSSWVLVFIISL